MYFIIQVALAVAIAPIVLNLLGISLIGSLLGGLGLIARPGFLLAALVLGFFSFAFFGSALFSFGLMVLVGLVAVASAGGAPKAEETKPDSPNEEKELKAG